MADFFNRKNIMNRAVHTVIENELEKLKTSNSSYFRGKSHFVDNDGTQNYSVFQPVGRCFRRIIGVGNNEYIYFWKSKSFLNKRINSITASKIRVKFDGSCLNQDKHTNTHGTIINIYIVYKITKNDHISSCPTLKNCTFGAVKLNKNPGVDKYKYCGYSTGFDRKEKFSFGDGFGHNTIFFGVDMSSSVHVDNKKEDIVLLGEGPTQGLGNTTLTTEKIYSINFTKNNKKFCLRLHYNEANSYLFVNGTDIIKSKAKGSEIVAYPLCLGNISKEFFVDDILRTGLNKYIYDFSVDYNAIAVD